MNIKNKIRIYLLPTLAKLLHNIGISWEKLGGTFLARSVLIAQTTSLRKFTVESNSRQQNIYFLTILPGSIFHLFTEALLALGLKQKGHNVTFIIDDNFLPIHELKRKGDEINWNKQAKINYAYASRFLNKLKLNYMPISKFIDDISISTNNNTTFDSILEATLLKHYKVGVISNDLPKLEEKTKLIKDSILITTQIGNKLALLNPDVVIMSHGIYSTWGPPFQILKENYVPILTYGRGKKRNTMVFNWNKTADTWDVSNEWEKVKDKELQEAQLKKINEYLASRISHKDDVFIYNFGKETTSIETINYLGLDSKKPIYTIFTNVLWDAASAQREIVFNNPVDWVIETIMWFNDHPEKQLIIKIHPAEVVIGTNMPFYDIIVSRITPKSNIRIIEPKEQVNSWSIYSITDLGIVHTTTVGMEMPLVNKPCMVVSKTHYRNKGFTIDINSKKEYFKILSDFDINNVDLVSNKSQALKYAYLLFIRYQIPFNMFFEKAPSDIRGFRYTKMVNYSCTKEYFNIIDCILTKKEIFNL